MTGSSWSVDAGAVLAKVRSPSGQLAQRLYRTGIDVSNESARRVNVNTGLLRSSRVVSAPSATGPSGRLTVTVSYRTKYARYVHDGRGPIVAAPGKVLAFKVGGRSVVVRSVRGYQGNPFLVSAAHDVVARLR